MKKLLDAIEDKELLFRASLHRWGKNDYRTRSYFYELMGLKEAFKIIFGAHPVKGRAEREERK